MRAHRLGPAVSPDLAIVGGGPGGLAVAAEVSARRHVVLIERERSLGGAIGADDARVSALLTACEEHGVELLTGTTATGWDNEGLRVATSAERGVIEVPDVVLATGTRPSTPAELRITGSRPAGIFATPAALRLLRAGVVLGRRAIVIGAGWSAGAAATRLRAQGATVTALSPEEFTTGDAAVVGRGRVAAVAIGTGRARREIECDVIVFADDLQPRRNIDGALGDATPGVHALRSLQPHARVEEVIAAAHVLAAALGSDMHPRNQIAGGRHR